MCIVSSPCRMLPLPGIYHDCNRRCVQWPLLTNPLLCYSGRTNGADWRSLVWSHHCILLGPNTGSELPGGFQRRDRRNGSAFHHSSVSATVLQDNGDAGRTFSTSTVGPSVLFFFHRSTSLLMLSYFGYVIFCLGVQGDRRSRRHHLGYITSDTTLRDLLGDDSAWIQILWKVLLVKPLTWGMSA